MKDAATSSWVAVVPLGPSEQDLQRLDDLLESIVDYEVCGNCR